MNNVEINKSMRLSEHFTLGEVCKTSHKTADGNIPSRVAIENLKNICENWLEDLRYSNNVLYEEVGSDGGQFLSARKRRVYLTGTCPLSDKTILLRQILRSL